MNLRKNLFWAIPFIVVGVVWIMRNTGMITDDLFHIIVSWQMLVMYREYFPETLYRRFDYLFGWCGIFTATTGVDG